MMRGSLAILLASSASFARGHAVGADSGCVSGTCPGDVPEHSALIQTSELKPEHTVIHLCDPQLGLHKQYVNATDWEAELSIVSELITRTNAFKPEFLLVGGDMQNYWPNEKDANGSAVVGRNRLGTDPTQPIQSDEFLLSGEIGSSQRTELKEVLKKSKGKVVTTAGNHDIGDAPDADTLRDYVTNWGPHYASFRKQKVLYLQISSQLYWDASDAATAALQAEQTQWLATTLAKTPLNSINRIVVLTHIAPFYGNHTEAHGWGNWPLSTRIQVLDLLAQYAGGKVPVLWLCGHFHTNVENTGYLYESSQIGKTLTMDILVTSSSGTSIWWTGADGSLSPEAASVVGSKPIGQAFFQDVILAGGIGELLQPLPERSGVRVLTMHMDGTYTQQWKTLADMRQQQS